MKEPLERHASRLAPEERRAIWEKIASARARRSHAAMRWTASAAVLGLVAVGVFLFNTQIHERSARIGTVPMPQPRATVKTIPPTDAPIASKNAPSPASTPKVRENGPASQEGSLSVTGEAVPPPPAPSSTPVLVGGKQVEEVKVSAQRMTDVTSSATRLSVGKVENLQDAIGLGSGVVATGGELHVKGGRSGEVRYQIDGVPMAQRMVDPNRREEAKPDAMELRDYGVQPFISTDEDRFSTFAVDVDAGSYTLSRRYLELGQLPPAAAVRIEEFVNFFPQDYPKFENGDFRILIDGAPSPFGAGYQLVRIGLKGREVAVRDRKPAQLTFVIDVSGSMTRENRLELVKASLRLLVDELKKDDRVGIVVYGSRGRVLLEPVDIARSDGRRRIVEAIESLSPEGSTNAEEGLQLGYEMARRAFRSGAINRIVLCSDGVANVGRTGPESILARVRTEADRGVHLTTIGFGMGNYNDVLMEQLADRGDGNHYYVDGLDEARRVLVENLTGTLQTIAKDAKVQVEFDSTRVARYRLLGFENRDVADRDFRNDKVDAGEIGAGHEVTALYEVKLASGVASGTLATVRLRYAKPEQEGAPQVREIERSFSVAALHKRFDDAPARFRLDAAVAEFGEILKGSYWAKESRLSDVLSVARRASDQLEDAVSEEFVALVEKAAALKAREESEKGR